MAGSVVLGDDDRHDQVSDHAQAAEEGRDRKAEPHQGGVYAQVVAQSAGDAPEHPVIRGTEQTAGRRPGLGSIVLRPGVLLVIGHALKMTGERVRVYRESPLSAP